MPYPDFAGGACAECGENTADAATGWEEERDCYIFTLFGDSGVSPGMVGPNFTGHHGGGVGLADNLD